MAKKKVNVSVADDHLDRFGEVVQSCKRAGMDVDQALETVGVVTGSIDDSKVAKLKKIKGVSAVERSRQVQLPDPSSDIQ